MSNNTTVIFCNPAKMSGPYELAFCVAIVGCFVVAGRVEAWGLTWVASLALTLVGAVLLVAYVTLKEQDARADGQRQAVEMLKEAFDTVKHAD